MGVSASDILSKVSDYDLDVIEVLKERDSGFTKIQIAKKLKRSLNDVKWSIHRLKISKHVKDWPWYGRVCLVDFDYSEQVVNKRPEEAALKIKELQLENEQLAKDKEELLSALAAISNMCIGEIAMGYKIDAQSIGELIFEATGLTNPQLNELEKHKCD